MAVGCSLPRAASRSLCGFQRWRRSRTVGGVAMSVMSIWPPIGIEVKAIRAITAPVRALLFSYSPVPSASRPRRAPRTLLLHATAKPRRALSRVGTTPDLSCLYCARPAHESAQEPAEKRGWRAHWADLTGPILRATGQGRDRIRTRREAARGTKIRLRPRQILCGVESRPPAVHFGLTAFLAGGMTAGSVSTAPCPRCPFRAEPALRRIPSRHRPPQLDHGSNLMRDGGAPHRRARPVPSGLPRARGLRGRFSSGLDCPTVRYND